MRLIRARDTSARRLVVDLLRCDEPTPETLRLTLLSMQSGKDFYRMIHQLRAGLPHSLPGLAWYKRDRPGVTTDPFITLNGADGHWKTWTGVGSALYLDTNAITVFQKSKEDLRFARLVYPIRSRRNQGTLLFTNVVCRPMSSVASASLSRSDYQASYNCD
jgi:hypothetical protein